MSAFVIPFRHRRALIRNCSRCGCHYRPRAAHHLLRLTCYYWRRALLGIAISNQAFEALRTGGYR